MYPQPGSAEMSTGVRSTSFLLFIQFGTPAHGAGATHTQSTSFHLSKPNLETHSETGPKIWFPGDSKLTSSNNHHTPLRGDLLSPTGRGFLSIRGRPGKGQCESTTAVLQWMRWNAEGSHAQTPLIHLRGPHNPQRTWRAACSTSGRVGCWLPCCCPCCPLPHLPLLIGWLQWLQPSHL